ncbi:hypothetical protein [Pseudonocardia acaciae]|uniref:hypothetical protein n=1 Tax=Pseudonocardia acaciae TaxID=551276 RepID=UPI00048C256C|nr:hypothetical protein [Pseudonocardia acaciae]
MVTIGRPDQVRAVLEDPGFIVPPAQAGGENVDVGWVRARVSRFANGEEHRQRRALVTELLAGVPARALRDDAFDRTRRRASDVIFDLARTVPTDVLAAALGVEVSAADVGAVARVYHPHVEADRAGDEAAARLVEACGGPADERAAARVALFVQARDATASLIENAAGVMLRTSPRPDPAAVIDRVLLDEPPVRATRRLDGTAVLVLDLARAQRESGQLFTFGAGHRACPGQPHARAIAHGVLDALRQR